MQDYGWEQDFSKKDGQQSGTTGNNTIIETSPKTGDNNNLLLWLALMILSASGTAGAVANAALGGLMNVLK